jgi:hypothetical protein
MALPGCPLEEPQVEGAWKLNIDLLCDGSQDQQLGMVLNADGSAQFYPTLTLTGTWSRTGNTIVVRFIHPVDFMLTGSLSLHGTSMSDGTCWGALNGCWTAEKLEF